METDRMKMWLELARQCQQGQFWDSVFDADDAKMVMEQFGAPAQLKQPAAAFPRADVYRGAREVIVLVDLPGVRKEDVELSIADGSLVVKGKSIRRYPELQPVQSERHKGEFERTLLLPETVASGAQVTARYDSGILEIRLPRPHRPRETIRID